MENWQQNFLSLTQLGQEEMLAVMEVAVPRTYRPGDMFATPDKVCKHIAFLTSGIARVYHLHDGKEITDYFNTTFRNQFVSSFVSFLKQQPSREYVEILTDAQMLLVDYNDLEKLYGKFKSIERLGRLMAERNYLLALERIESLQYRNATERYESFLKLYPQLINQIPNHYIASYLGVTPESLSRIRKNLVR